MPVWVLSSMRGSVETKASSHFSSGTYETPQPTSTSTAKNPFINQLAAPPNQLRLRQSIALAPQTFNYSSSNSLGFDTASSTYIKRAHRETGATSYHLNNHRCETLQTY
ncbi:Uncharacterized protein HZ326_13453 [Fusarium oxysporum f. sp. albedinis]|nr:Uncharacterized protein HZ326_13453 [Fusarium oxysporum f. sp. albedinis]